jgi:hypothetical protein
MATKHYYAMHTPQGNAVDSNGTPIGTVYMFAKKRERDDWAEDNYYSTWNGNAKQTRTITEHDARVIMLRQYGRAMAEWHNRHGLPYSYREYSQYYPTALMHGDYSRIVCNWE